MEREDKIYDAFGGHYVKKAKKTEGWYQNIKSKEIQWLLEPCKGWRKL